MTSAVEHEIEGSAPIALYRLYDAAGALLYVGITHSLSDRFAQHAAGKPWWPEVARRTAVWCASRQDAEVAEKAAIGDEGPLYNVTVSPPPAPVKGERGRRKTNAEYQAAYRARRAVKTAALEQSNASLYAEIADVRRQLATLRSALADANTEIVRLESAPGQRNASCADCGRELACPACYRAGDF